MGNKMPKQSFAEGWLVICIYTSRLAINDMEIMKI